MLRPAIGGALYAISVPLTYQLGNRAVRHLQYKSEPSRVLYQTSIEDRAILQAGTRPRYEFFHELFVPDYTGPSFCDFRSFALAACISALNGQMWLCC